MRAAGERRGFTLEEARCVERRSVRGSFDAFSCTLKTRIFYTSPWMIARQTARFPCWYKQNPATVKPESADSDGTPAALLTTCSCPGSESHVGSVGDQPPTDGFGTCSLHRFTRALKCVLREETRPKEKMIVTPEGGGVNSRAVRGPPPVPLGRVASFIASHHPPASPARAQVQAGRVCLSFSRRVGAGSASMPTLWSVSHREPFQCASRIHVVSPLA